MIPGTIPGKAATGGGPLTATFLSQGGSSSNLSSYTFSSLSLGAADDNKWIAACVWWRDLGGTLDAVTIDGVSAVELIRQADDVYTQCSIWIAEVSSASGDLEISGDGTGHRCGYGLWALEGMTAARATPTDTGYDNGSAPSLTLDVTEGGLVLAHWCDPGGSGTVSPGSWTGVTEGAAGGTLETSGYHYGAHEVAADETGRTISNSATDGVLTAVAFS